MAVHLQPFCGKLNKLRGQPATNDTRMKETGCRTTKQSNPVLTLTFRAKRKSSWSAETRVARYGQRSLCRAVNVPDGRQSTLHACHSEARHVAGQARKGLARKMVWKSWNFSPIRLQPAGRSSGRQP